MHRWNTGCGLPRGRRVAVGTQPRLICVCILLKGRIRQAAVAHLRHVAAAGEREQAQAEGQDPWRCCVSLLGELWRHLVRDLVRGISPFSWHTPIHV